MSFTEWSNKKKKEREQSGKVSTQVTSGSKQATSSFSEWSANKAASRVDQDYINTFIKDSSSFIEDFLNQYQSDGYKNASSLYDSTRRTLSDFDSRYNTISKWLDINKSNIDKETYGSVKSFLDSYQNSSSSILKEIENAKNLASKGWETYLSDKAERDANREKQKKAEEEAKANESFWDKLGRYLGGVQDTTLPTSTVSSVVNEMSKTSAEEAQLETLFRFDTDNYTKEQKEAFGRLYATDKQAAAEYAKAIELGKAEEFATKNFGTGLLATVESVLSSPITGMADFLTDIAEYNARGAITTKEASPFEYSQAGTQAITEHLNAGGTAADWIPVVGGKGWGDVYGLGTSIAQSWLTAATGGGLQATVSFFGSAAASAVDDALARGASDSQAINFGFVSGVAEAAAEYLPTEMLLGKGGNKGIKAFFKGIRDQMIAEGIEEGATSLLTNIADNIIIGENSQFNKLVEAYMQKGLTQEEATRKAWAKTIEDIAFDALAGAVSGGISGAVFSGGSYAFDRFLNTEANKNAVDTYGESSQELLGEALEIGDADAKKYAEKLQKKLDGGKSLSGYEIRKMVEANDRSIEANDVAEIKKKTAVRLAELGEEGEVDKLAGIIAKKALGESLTHSEKATLDKSKYGTRVSNELDPNNIKAGAYSSAWTDSITTNRINDDVYGGWNNAESAAPKTSAQEASPEVLKGDHKVSESGNTVYVNENGEAENVSIKKIVSTEGDVKVELDNGKTVSVKDLELSTDAEAMAYEMVTRMETTPETAQVIFEAVKASDATSVQELFIGVPTAYRYGKINYEAGLKGIRIPDAVKRLAFDRGRSDAMPTTTEAQQTEQNATDEKAAPTQKKGKVVFEGFKYSEDSATDMQKASMAGINLLAKMSSLEIHVYASWVEDGERYAMVGGKKRVAPNGWHEEGTNKIYIDINAGNKGEGAMLYTLGHEVTHHIANWNWDGFKKLGDFLIENFGKNNVPVDILIERKKQTLIKSYQRDGKAVPGDNQLFMEAYEEVVAEAMTSMFTDPKAYDKLAELKKQDKKLWQKLGEAIKKMLDKLKSLLGVYDNAKPGAREADFVAKFSKDVYEQLQDLYLKAFVEADANYQASNLVSIDTASESVSPKFSERTWSASEYVTEREEAAKNISQALGVDIKTAYKYIDDINGVARLIADDRARLDYEPNLDEKATVLKPNSEYKYSVDMSTLCAKRLLFTGTFDAIQKALPNTVFDSEDIVSLREMMQKRGYEVACGICYVESTRREIGRITQEFIDRYKVAQKTGKPISRINSSGKEVVLKSAGRTFSADKNYTPNLGELNTTDIDIVKRDHREVYDAYLAFMNARGQAKPKLLETRAEYKGEILKHFKAKSAVEARNNAGGLRLQSFSDFEVPHMIDMMQIVMDMSRVGLKSQAYTKVPAFAEVFGDSGVKINLSLIAKGDGLDANGNLIFDDVEGINHAEAFKLRDTYSKNVGTILVGKTDAHIIAAMADPRIDYIIPFHKSSWKESLYDALGLTGYADYTDFQNEKPIDKDRKISNFDPSEYWDFTKTGDENAQTYLEKCREDGRIPKFPQFQGYPGYWKLLIDFKMYDNDGVGSPQEVVRPVFNTEASERILREYEGGHKSFPIAKDVVEDFVEEHQNKVKYCERDDSPNAFNPNGKTLKGQLKEALDTSESKDWRYVYVGEFTQDFIDKLKKHIDIKKLPIVMNYRDAYLSMEAKERGKYQGDGISYHNLGVDGLEAALKSFDDPVYVLLSTTKGKIELVLKGTDYKNRQLFSIVEVNTKTQNNRKFMDVHVVTSVYGNRGLKNRIAVADNEGRIIYKKMEESTQGIPQVQYERDINADSSNKSIPQDSDSVKRNFSERDNVGYHAGDLGKAEYYHQQGYGRGTGHFGTGTYFVGEEAKISGSTYGNRPHHAVDFNDYKLYKIKSDKDGYDLHEQLKVIDGGLSAEWLNAAFNDEFRLFSVTDGYDIAREKFGENIYTNDALLYGFGELAKRRGIEVLSKAEYAEREGVDTSYEWIDDDYVEYLKNTIEEEAEKVNDSYGEFRDAYFHLWLRFGSNNTKRALQETLRYQQEINPDGERNYFAEKDKKADSLATVFMKSLGYEGIDVRGTRLDNTEYGSVIYDLKEATILYQERDPDSISNRSLLANALESAVQEGEERNLLRNYKTNLRLIEAEQAKLADVRQQAHDLRFKKGRTEEETKKLRGLDFEAKQIATRINSYDRELLKIEAMQPIKAVLNREKQMAYKRAEQKGKEALKKQRERASENYKKLLAEKQESRQKAIESRHKTEMRHKIKKVVGDLNTLLLHPTKDNHVPIGLQLVVADALDAINMDTMNAAERVAYYNDRIAKSNNPDEIEMLTKKRDFFEYRDMSFKDKVTALKNAYEEFKNSDDPLIKNAHNDAIVNLIENTSDVVGKKSLKDMSYEQLEAVYNMYKAVLATVRNANKMFKEGRQETVTSNSESVKTEVRSVGGHQDRVLKATKFLKKFGWDMLKPITALKVIGSDTLASLFDNVRAGEDTWAVDVSEAKEFYKNVSTKYGYKDWDFKKRYSFKDGAGHDFSLSLEQIMSLYAYSKRDQADRHLEVGGFIFDDAIEVTEKTKVGIPMKYEVNDANPYRLRREDLLAVIDSLSNEQKGFIDEMQSYLSDVMGAKGNEVSLAMYDIKLYNEKNYFPLKTSRYFREFDPEKSATPKIKNAGFSKKTVPQAGNPIVLSNFMDVWASHVNDMSMYHAFVLPLEDFTRVYNYSSTAGGYDSVQQYIKNAYGAQANQYIERLLDDLNGGARVDSSAGVINKGLSLFKKASVFASASVVVQQPSAIARAFAYVDPKYFAAATGSALNIAKHKELWAEVKKYAPVAVIKEMGYFDTGIGRSSVDWIKGNQTIMDKVDDALSKAPAIADELAWSHIWLAVKREVKATTNLKEGSEEFLKKAGKRFTEVIVNTQVYDSVLSRSGMMRSKDTGMKMATAFMAEPTTTANMMIDGIIQGKRGNKKFLAATVGGVSASIVLNSILVALVYGARDDDEDETYAEKYLGSLTSELLDGFNPLTYIPFVKDIWSIAQGYDVERSDMTVVSNLWESIERIFNENTSGWDKVADVSGAVSSLFGIPLKNIIRDAKGLYNLFATITSGVPTTKAGVSDAVEDAFKSSIPLWDRLNDSKTNADRLYEAIVSGDQAQIDRIKGRFKGQDAITSAIRKALRENDPRIKEAAQADFDGDVEEYDRIINEIIREGNFDKDDILAAVKSERNGLEPEDEEDDSPAADKEVSIYTVEHYFTAIKSGKTSLANSAKDDIIKTAVANGKSMEDAESSFYSSFRNHAKKVYAEGGLTRSEAERMLIQYGNREKDDAYWDLKEWDYFKQNGTEDGYSKYNSFYESVQTGRNLKAVIKEYTSHGVEAATLSRQITNYFKPLYVNMSNSERAKLKGYLLNAYVQLGYSRAEKMKDINNWLKDKD